MKRGTEVNKSIGKVLIEKLNQIDKFQTYKDKVRTFYKMAMS